MDQKHEILLGLTTTPKSDWRGKVEEMRKFGIKKIALFPTFLKSDERKELYKLLESVNGLEIPHVHLRREDMEKWEMEWFEKHGAKFFNVHMNNKDNDILNDTLLPYGNQIFVENHVHKAIPEVQLKNCAGICLDFQHWQRSKNQFPDVDKKTKEYADKYKVGCCHISALPKLKNVLFRIFKRVGGHYMFSLDEFDYIGQYQQYLPQYISLELENSFEEQLKVKEYLERKFNLM